MLSSKLCTAAACDRAAEEGIISWSGAEIPLAFPFSCALVQGRRSLIPSQSLCCSESAVTGAQNGHTVRKYRIFRVFTNVCPRNSAPQTRKAPKRKDFAPYEKDGLVGLKFHFVLALVFLLLSFIFRRDSSDSRAFIEILDMEYKGNESHCKLPKDISIT